MIIIGDPTCGLCAEKIVGDRSDCLYVPRFMFPIGDPFENIFDSFCHISCLDQRGMCERATLFAEDFAKRVPPFQEKCILCDELLAGDPALPIDQRVILLETEAIALQSPVTLGGHQGTDVIYYQAHYSCIVSRELLNETLAQVNALPKEYERIRTEILIMLDRARALHE